MNWICQHCGVSFVPKDKGHLKRNPPQFCSRACRSASIRKRIEMKCDQCGVTFLRKRYLDGWSGFRGVFCSSACYGLWQRGKKAEKAPTPPKTGPEWDRARQAALDRDGHRCTACGSTRRLNVHHKEHWKPGDGHELDNLTTLCVPCHKLLHPHRHKQNPAP